MTTTDCQTRARLRPIAGAGLVVVVAACSGWTGCSSAEPPPLVVLVSGDTAGWIVPCGCASNQSGGLSRRGAYVRQTANEAAVVLCDAGGAASGASDYQRAKFEAILQGERAMGFDAHNLGQAEIELGTEYLAKIAATLDIPFVSTNVRSADGQPLFEPMRIVERAGRRVAVLGVVAQRYAQPGFRVEEPRQAILDVLGRIEGPLDATIVLAYLPEDELRELAGALPEVDVVCGGPTGQPVPPEQIGPTLLVSATKKGKFLARLEAPRLRSGQRWTGAVVEMTAQLPNDPRQQQNLDRFYEALARHDFAAEQTGLAAVLPAELPATYHVAGTQSCHGCHQDDCESWAASKHAAAWQTLAAQSAHVDSYCQQCHTTGFGLPGGFASAARTPDRTSVGCESCHGPSLAHRDNPHVRTPFAAKDQCLRCHDRENSPGFAYDSYWSRIEHGAKGSLAASSAKPQSKDREVQP